MSVMKMMMGGGRPIEYIGKSSVTGTTASTTNLPYPTHAVNDVIILGGANISSDGTPGWATPLYFNNFTNWIGSQGLDISLAGGQQKMTVIRSGNIALTENSSSTFTGQVAMANVFRHADFHAFGWFNTAARSSASHSIEGMEAAAGLLLAYVSYRNSSVRTISAAPPGFEVIDSVFGNSMGQILLAKKVGGGGTGGLSFTLNASVTSLRVHLVSLKRGK